MVINPEASKKFCKLFLMLLFLNKIKLKKQIDAAAHQNKIPILETTPTKGFILAIAEGSFVKLLIETPVVELTNITKHSSITIGVYSLITTGNKFLI